MTTKHDPAAASSTAPAAARRVAVVTGSSSGIGRATAVELARLGMSVVVHGYRHVAGAEETLDACCRAAAHDAAHHAAEHRLLSADLSSSGGCQDFADAAWRAFGRVDVWVNNAGADILTGEASDAAYDDKLQRLWEVDVLGTIRLSRDIGERMRWCAAAHFRPLIVNIGWDQAERGMAGESGELFAATKGAVMAFTKSLAQSLAPVVRVNCIAPGWIQTAWGAQASLPWQQRARRESLSERWGTPQDIAALIGFLASPGGEFINGQVIVANGGFRYGAESLP